MYMFPSSKADPMTLERRGNYADQTGEPIDMDGFVQVYGPPIAGETTGVVLFYGQSNVGNFVNAVYTMTQSKCHMLDPYSGAVYEVKEPVVGCNGGLPGSNGYAYGNTSAETADRLRAAGWRQRVVICNVSAGGTSSTQWANGDCTQRLRVACRRLLAAGLVPTVVVRHQGETDTTSGFSSTLVRDNIRAEKAILIAEGVTAPLLVCKVARTSAASVGSAPYLAVRQGQTDALSTLLGIYAGPDTDVYGASHRYDDLHFNATGRAAVSADIASAVVALVP